MPHAPKQAPLRKVLLGLAVASSTLLGGCRNTPDSRPPSGTLPNTAESEVEPSLRAAVKANPKDAGAQLRLIEHLQSQRRRYAALEAAESARLALPDDTRILRHIAETLATLGRSPEAALLLVAPAARDAQLRVTRAGLLAREGKREEAVRLLQALETRESAELARSAAQVYFDALRPDLAGEILRPHAVRPGSVLDLRSMHALALLLEGRYKAAGELLSAVVREAPQVPVLRYYLGSALRLSGDTTRVTEAAEHLQQATTLAPNEPLFHYEQALAHVQLRDLSSAQQSMERAAALAPDLTETQRDLGRIYARLLPPDMERSAATRARYLLLLEDPAAVIHELEPVHRRSPGHPGIVQSLALAYHEAKQSETAVAILNRLTASRPEDLQRHWELFRAERVSKQPERALTTLAAIERGTGAEPLEILHERADLLQRLNRYEEAEALYQELCTREPQNPVRHFELGLFLKLWSKRPDRIQAAEKSFREALRLRSDYVGPRFRLGEILEADGRAQEAVTHLERAHELAPELWDALRPLARAYTRLGREREAKACFQAYRRFQERDETKRQLELVSSQGRATRQSRRRLYQFLLDTGQLSLATRELERYVHFHPEDREARRQLARLFGSARRFQRQFEERTAADTGPGKR